MNKIKSKGKKIMAAFLLLYGVAGCSDDYLVDERYDGLTDEIVFNDPETASAVVTSIYDTFHGGPVEYLTKAIFYPANFLSQDFKNIGSDAFFQTFQVPVTFQPLNAMWTQNYMGIGRANNAIYNINNMIDQGNIEADYGHRLVSESMALRGILYSMMSSNFGGVPLVLQPAELIENPQAPRNSQEEVFRQVIEDMQYAVQYLPWDYPGDEIGRITKGAAYAYMGNAYMWLGEYQNAIDAYTQLEGHYVLEEEFLRIHANDNQNGPESIFEVQLYDDAGDLGWGRDDNVTFIQSFNMPNEIGNGGGYAVPTEQLYQSFEEGDERKLPTVIGPGDVHPDPEINIEDYPVVQENFGGINTLGTEENPWKGIDGLPGREGYYAVKLWRNPIVDGWSGPDIFGGQNLIFLRYGQVLLSLAEAYHKVGDDGTAMDYLMRIRNRAGLTQVPDGNLMDAILEEYRHELVGEFSLWWLLRRSGEQREYIQEHFDITIPEGKDLMPIPQEQIDVNANLVQNPGY
ncbi:RagB/SusD family nutrient uptake outer membrane protein [Zunongwangia sp. F363]|uniref:RagB/SusD family nutrient uptake outer membrane protein n=1 Tax=Autumnicola tepida TaxID=3075595 RepID=A0ABU3CBP5_9FLAO|nr:RagB/SusD family nutrient uptake outer membrane protein [Zunongwangia sp. F363]MDT0643754.1 RagB/SusD family nutrient uptake outer membrane protein [Zunongwangia sp. F363]